MVSERIAAEHGRKMAFDYLVKLEGLYDGPEDTTRFYWPEEETPPMSRLRFIEEVLFGVCGMDPGEIFCLQDNYREKGYDVTFCNDEVHMRALDAFKKKPVKGLRLRRSYGDNMRIVTLHMYNPRVSKEAVMGFVGRYAQVLKGTTEKMVGDYGIWTGTWRMATWLRSDPEGYEGRAHPPAFFEIGRDRGYLQYWRQPPFCRRCRRSGHTYGTCDEEVRCRLCSETGHKAAGCTRSRACHGCGSRTHMVRDCPGRGGAAGGATGGGVRADVVGTGVAARRTVGPLPPGGAPPTAGGRGSAAVKESVKVAATTVTPVVAGPGKGGARTAGVTERETVGSPPTTGGSSSADERGSAEVATPPEAPVVAGPEKGEVRSGTTAFNGEGAQPPGAVKKKMRTVGEPVDVMDTLDVFDSLDVFAFGVTARETVGPPPTTGGSDSAGERGRAAVATPTTAPVVAGTVTGEWADHCELCESLSHKTERCRKYGNVICHKCGSPEHLRGTAQHDSICDYVDV